MVKSAIPAKKFVPVPACVPVPEMPLIYQFFGRGHARGHEKLAGIAVVKYLITLLFPLYLLSAEFEASVSRNPVNSGESFSLSLTLTGASAKGTPSLNPLKGQFVINSQQQISNVSVINGQTTSSTTWKLTLLPLREGDVVIPSISLDTSEGILSTLPINVQVAKGDAPFESEGVFADVSFSTLKPYKNEPFMMTVRLNSNQEMVNVEMQEIQLEDAMVELSGEPNSYFKKINGVNQSVVEFSYLITPLKAGSLKIPSTYLKGRIPLLRKGRGGFGPFGAMQGYDQKPFVLATEEASVEVQPPQMSPWLPAKSLKIEEIWNSEQALQAGEPLSRGFMITAVGAMSAGLPSLDHAHGADVKAYADKPEVGHAVKEGVVHSYRKENYTLIPQSSGTLTLPEIAVEWWDVSKEEKGIAKIPPRTLQVLPQLKQEPLSETGSTPLETVERDPLVYILLALLGVLLLIASAWAVALKRKIDRLTHVPVVTKKKEVPQAPAKKKEVKDKKEKLPDLNPT